LNCGTCSGIWTERTPDYHCPFRRMDSGGTRVSSWIRRRFAVSICLTTDIHGH
jgi:hypothetical protein